MAKNTLAKSKGFTAIVLAAGKGVRMKSPLPKVLHELCGMPLVWYVLRELSSLRRYVKQIIVVVGHDGEAVRAAVKKSFSQVEFVYQKKQLGTAHAVMAARTRVKCANTLILCGDAPLVKRETLAGFIGDFIKNNTALSLVTACVPEPGGLGRIIRNEDDCFSAIREAGELSAAEKEIKEVSSGIYAAGSRVLFGALRDVKRNPGKGEYYLTDIVGLVRRGGGMVSAYAADDYREVLGVNSLRELNIAEQAMRRRIIDILIDSGVKIIDPALTYIEEGAKIGKGTVIFPFTFIEKNVIIGNICRLGPFVRIRQGTRVKDGVCLGNFLEVNRCRVAGGVVAKHFGYLGDARIDSGVNVGAGTVIANYDGKNKNKTTIGKRVFIGCDSILVAPVKIGNGAVTGAGSVVTHNVKPKTVVVGVPARALRKSR